MNDSKGDNKKHVYVVRKTKGWVRMNKNNGKVIAIVEQGKLKEKERMGKDKKGKKKKKKQKRNKSGLIKNNKR